MKELALICWVLLALDGSVHSELTNANFAKCKRFFYKGTAPTGYESQYPLDLAYICQIFQNNYRFASLYHKTKRIPIYSAYIMNPKGGHRPQGPNFKVEPQLVDKNLNKEMLTEDEVKKAMTTHQIPSILFPDSQALNADYENSVYVKGHLNPVADQKYVPGKCSTCTLTNAVPMDATFNNGGWKSYEIKIRKKNKDLKCKTMYVLRGVIPGKTWIRDSTGNRVNVPDQHLDIFRALTHSWWTEAVQCASRKRMNLMLQFI